MRRTIFITFIVMLAFMAGVCFVPTASAKGKPSSGQSLPWGVDRIDADNAWDTTKGFGVQVAVIDTGIDKAHLDLVGKTGGINFFRGGLAW